MFEHLQREAIEALSATCTAIDRIDDPADSHAWIWSMDPTERTEERARWDGELCL